MAYGTSAYGAAYGSSTPPSAQYGGWLLHGAPSAPGQMHAGLDPSEGHYMAQAGAAGGRPPIGQPPIGQLDAGPSPGATAAAAAPPTTKKAGGFSILPILLLAFFGCFMYHNWQRSKPGGGRSSGHEDRVGLIDYFRPGRSNYDKRPVEMRPRPDFNRARPNDHDDPEDGML